jgi:hypothetical protein
MENLKRLPDEINASNTPWLLEGRVPSLETNGFALLNGREKPTGIDNLLVSIRKVPADNNTRLATAYNPSSIKLKFEDSSHVGWKMVMWGSVIMMVSDRLRSW